MSDKYKISSDQDIFGRDRLKISVEREPPLAEKIGGAILGGIGLAILGVLAGVGFLLYFVWAFALQNVWYEALVATVAPIVLVLLRARFKDGGLHLFIFATKDRLLLLISYATAFLGLHFIYLGFLHRYFYYLGPWGGVVLSVIIGAVFAVVATRRTV